ncbi:peptidoglycan hydrolase RipC [Mycolicibacterium goodii]|uniref:Peptidoglycan hydrolase RipC n=1 Tax=Mycolicibacterium goodii TaxID=134601 RepID=A0ABS6HJB6_MYCGD|nr:peptidoglycan hydrolase RipC [Mycolicibacterium goodii]MBU8822777.1 peptidoglycan hydrolase RipC [Mycolicibacterium goodii]MBU8838871.1 peptidoglycan hydrolase RipC [Mycolicibacterium goodii]
MRTGRLLASVLVAVAMSLVGVSAGVNADPAADALATLNELSRRAEQTTEAMHSAQLDLDAKLAAQRDAETQKSRDEMALTAAREQLQRHQSAVDKVAAATYMGGNPNGLTAVLTAESPQQLIDELAINRAMSTEMTDQIRAFRIAHEQAQAAARSSQSSAAAARSAAEQAAAVRAELQARQSQLQREISAVQAQYEALTPDQRATMADPGPPPPPTAVPPPTVAPDPAVVALPAPPVPGDGPPQGNTPEPSGQGALVVQAALTRVGAPYSWGAAGPDAFDCSGLIMWAFQQTGKSLPHSSQALAAGGQPVAVSDLQAGDIVTFYDDVSHAGIYIGDGMMVHASTFGTPVRVAPISSAPIHNARRW